MQILNTDYLVSRGRGARRPFECGRLSASELVLVGNAGNLGASGTDQPDIPRF
jgi:hypothetical protein